MAGESNSAAVADHADGQVAGTGEVAGVGEVAAFGDRFATCGDVDVMGTSLTISLPLRQSARHPGHRNRPRP
jgi:hypothetical protein